MKKDSWPKNSKGENKKFGELTAAQKKQVLKESFKRLRVEMSSPEFKKAFESNY